MKKIRINNISGVTLLELLISIGLMVIVLIAVNQLLVSTLAHSAVAKAESEVNQNLRIAHLRMADEIRDAVNDGTGIIIPSAAGGVVNNTPPTNPTTMIKLKSAPTANSACDAVLKSADVNCFIWSASDQLQLRQGVADPADLTTRNTKITAMSVTRLDNGTQRSLQIYIQIKYIGPGSSYEKGLRAAYAIH